MKEVIAFSGSNSSTSINQDLINKIADQKDNVHVMDLTKFDIPLFSVDLEKENGIPSGVEELVNQIKKYSKVIISTPEHNGALPAFFKNILDWISRHELKFLEDKKVIILSTSPGKRGGIEALHALENQLNRYSGANIIHKQPIGNYQEKVKDNKLIEEIKNVLETI